MPCETDRTLSPRLILPSALGASRRPASRVGPDQTVDHPVGAGGGAADLTERGPGWWGEAETLARRERRSRVPRIPYRRTRGEPPVRRRRSTSWEAGTNACPRCPSAASGIRSSRVPRAPGRRTSPRRRRSPRGHRAPCRRNPEPAGIDEHPAPVLAEVTEHDPYPHRASVAVTTAHPSDDRPGG